MKTAGWLWKTYPPNLTTLSMGLVPKKGEKRCLTPFPRGLLALVVANQRYLSGSNHASRLPSG
jgi:hypothetical protein